MSKGINLESVINEFKRFLKWESQSFDNWESIEIFVADTLSEAWIKARPQDEKKFLDRSFKRMVDHANGKWLEKVDPSDSYKIILSTRYGDSVQSLTKCLVHEMRHCLDYQNAVKELPFDAYSPGNDYYINWSEFRAVYAQVRYEFFVNRHDRMRDKDMFDLLAGILGKYSADAVTGLLRSHNDVHDTLYFLSRYIGAARAVRNLNMEFLDAEVFHLWTMTPQYIIEKFGYVFYVGNEWDDTQVCALNAVPKTHYYNAMVDRIIAP